MAVDQKVTGFAAIVPVKGFAAGINYGEAMLVGEAFKAITGFSADLRAVLPGTMQHHHQRRVLG